jgi:hypothetical protein
MVAVVNFILLYNVHLLSDCAVLCFILEQALLLQQRAPHREYDGGNRHVTHAVLGVG